MRTSLRTNFLTSSLGLDGERSTFNLLLRGLWITTGPIQIVPANTSGSEGSVETGSVRHCNGWIVVSVMGFEFKIVLKIEVYWIGCEKVSTGDTHFR
ncbi:hypothetical protein AO1008_07558 [Aspergillus oryzae 100-8]|uniref:Uncharacterized protein n=1 Tax=Aspergillus oryzae (strain 3.042) TaxID=1160506 RepID=I8A7H5_ASPO3|nr:hypothetical protein Ao3042_02447 [Aspergillus oryzae 3.042]KDE81148.1 hypothetical protein AO1008_07558 [Aspergillus oryzae 100-8]|eukprot:EIT81072.1 hypothetical protein Ao3042_02447 [Aspergillus oryzae 3.042]